MRSEARARSWALIALLCPAVLLAEGPLIPYVSAQAEYNSNIFSSGKDGASPGGTTAPPGATVLDGLIGILQPGNPPPANSQTPDQAASQPLSDKVLRYVAGVEVRLPLSNQKLRAIFEGRRFEFKRFSQLDHEESLAAGGLDWRLSGALDGSIDYRQERRMASFADRDTTELTLERERISSGRVNLAFNPDWRLETGLRSRDLDSPLPDFPAFRLRETAVSVAVRHLIEDALSSGAYAEYLSGRFEGISDARQFRQQSVGLTAEYLISGLSRIGAELGHTRRRDEGSDAQSALTGLLSYHRELSGKTAADVQTFRRVRSYVGGASSVEETGAGAAIAWRPTEKILVAGTYQRTRGRFQDSASSSSDQGRRDNSQAGSLTLTYQMRPWLALRPYGGYQDRKSNSRRDSFRTEIAGIELLARFQ